MHRYQICLVQHLTGIGIDGFEHLRIRNIRMELRDTDINSQTLQRVKFYLFQEQQHWLVVFGFDEILLHYDLKDKRHGLSL